MEVCMQRKLSTVIRIDSDVIKVYMTKAHTYLNKILQEK